MAGFSKTLAKKGFTLIELLIVIAIIGVLAGFILPNVQSSLGRARDAQRRNDLRVIQNALEQYHNDNGRYPTGGWINSANANGGFWITDASGKNLTAQYIKSMPVDPKNSCPPNTTTKDRSDCFTYAYYSSTWCDLSGATDGYILTTRLEQYSKTDLSQKPYYLPNGTLCSNWVEDSFLTDPRAVGIYTVSNP